MLSIGWVMFWKAVVLVIAAAAIERWHAFRKRRQRDGLPLRRNKSGVYVVSDWTAKVERWAVYARRAVYALFGAWWVVLAVLLITR